MNARPAGVKRVLGIDYGDRRVGVALSDPLGLIAAPQEVIRRLSDRQVAGRIAALVAETAAEAVIVGLPMDAGAFSDNPQARRIRRFAAVLEEYVPVPLHFWDETLSSVEAGERLWASGARRRRGPIDHIAAAVMLQSFLDSRPPEE